MQHFAAATAAAALRTGGVLPAFANLSFAFAESLRDAGVLAVSNYHSMSLAFGVLGHTEWSHRGIRTHLHRYIVILTPSSLINYIVIDTS